MISDAQIHIWEADRPDRPWMPGVNPHLPEPVTAERIIGWMDDAGIDRAVLNPLYTAPYHRSDYAFESVAKYPDRFRVMGWYQPADPTALGRLATWLDQPGMCSIRLSLNTPEAMELFTSGAIEPFWSACEQYAIPVAVFRMGGVGVLGPVAAAHPRLRLIIDHLGMPVPIEARESRIDELISLARYSNVGVKVSALPNFSAEPAPFADLQPILQRVYRAFGADRLMWGTDISMQVARNGASYRECLDLIRVGAAGYIPPADIDRILNGTLSEWFNWP